VFSSLTEWVTDVIDSLGYIGVALLVALENLFPPIPSEIVLPFAGFVARDGDANLIGMIVAATIGSLIGAWILYGIAAWIGPDRMESFLLRFGKWLRLTKADIDRSEAWFDRHSNTAVLVCRCVPLIRSLISIPAGFRRMPFVRFSLYTALGSLVWNAALIGAGYGLRSRWEDVEPVVSYLQYAVIAAVAAAVGWYVWRKFLSPSARADRSTDATSASSN
jgi:membrane protein DedA with SNARE-associated domain